MQRTELPKLFGVSRVGKVKQWQAFVEENENGTATMIVETGYVGQKIRPIPKIIKKGKNLGRSNETTPFAQAVLEAQSKWNGKRDENYEPEQMDPDNYTPRLMLPMLAKKPEKGKIVYPCFVQPKFNGVCNLAEISHNPDMFKLPPEILHHSRHGKLFPTLQHLDIWIEKFNPPAPLHGELYYHGWSLQKIRSYTQKIRPDQGKLQYWLYDMALLNTPFTTRMEWLESVGNLINKNFHRCPIKISPTYMVTNYDEAKKYHDLFVQQGYEGAMLKNANGLYMFQYNSNDIEKMKEFQDDEFEIIGGKEGVGTDTGCIIYRCITKDGKEFDARPKGTVEDRQQMFIELPNDVGKPLTVRFSEYSDDGIPQHPVGVPEAEAVRDYE